MNVPAVTALLAFAQPRQLHPAKFTGDEMLISRAFVPVHDDALHPVVDRQRSVKVPRAAI